MKKLLPIFLLAACAANPAPPDNEVAPAGIWVTKAEVAAINKQINALRTKAEELDEEGFRLFEQNKKLELQLAKKGGCA
jgi:hypothetical protein